MAGEHASDALESMQALDELHADFTQHGLRMPDGTILWAPLHVKVGSSFVTTTSGQAVVSTSEDEDRGPVLPLHTVDLAQVEREHGEGTPGTESRKLRGALEALAASAYIDQGEYAQRVVLVQRQVTLILGEPEDSGAAEQYVRGA